MFVAYLSPFGYPEQKITPYHWILLRLCEEYPEAYFILDSSYLTFENSTADQKKISVMKERISTIPHTFYRNNEVAHDKMHDPCRYILLNQDDEYEQFLTLCLQKLNNLEGIIIWGHCPAMERVADKFKLPVIHNSYPDHPSIDEDIWQLLKTIPNQIQQIRDLNSAIVGLQKHVENLESSLSWRLTKPLRKLRRIGKSESNTFDMLKSTPIHLGGHFGVTHLDPSLLNYFKKHYGTKTFLDIGCGPGGMVILAESMGFKACGVDGDPTVLKNNSEIHLHDFEKEYHGPLLNKVFDLGWSVEFLEHVEERYLANYMALFKRCRKVVCTAAPPGTPGHHHVNCQSAQYWIEKFKEYGLIYDNSLTDICRRETSMEREFMAETGMVFINKFLL